MSDKQITQLLYEWTEGDEQVLEELTPLVYHRLKTIAYNSFGSEAPGHTLQPTALVNEAFSQLASVDINFRNRAHFYALSARIMRRILVDHARAKQAAKRGGNVIQVTFDDASVQANETASLEVLMLDQALNELDAFDSRKAEVLTLHYFSGLTYNELSSVIGVSESTVHQDLRVAKAWLKSRLAVD